MFAAGDAIAFPVKHGGLAAQQADTAAAAIARLAGGDVEAAPFSPQLRGKLLTGGKPLYLSARLVGTQGFESEVSETPPWPSTTRSWPPSWARIWRGSTTAKGTLTSGFYGWTLGAAHRNLAPRERDPGPHHDRLHGVRGRSSLVSVFVIRSTRRPRSVDAGALAHGETRWG